MTRRQRTSGVQRRERASGEALNRRLDDRGGRGGGALDWRLLAIGGLLAVGVVVVVVAVLASSAPNPNAGIALPDDGGAHVGVGVDCRDPAQQNDRTGCGSEPYSSVPAASGPHWDPSGVANWGVYTAPQPETQLVHNLEHGGIVIWYDAEALDAAAVEQLAGYVRSRNSEGVGGRFKFILTPWGGEDPLPSAVVATAWRYMLQLETADTSAIDGFARAHYGDAPEPNGGPGPPG
jgi:hypothetical protein